MSAEVSFDAAGGVICVREHGRVTAEDFAASVRSIRALHARTGSLRVLVDARDQAGATSDAGLYERATHAARALRVPGMRIALVVEGPLEQGHEFFATVSQNRGLTVRSFRDRASALSWLEA